MTEKLRLIQEAFKAGNYADLVKLDPLMYVVKDGKVYKRTEPGHSTPELTEAFFAMRAERLSEDKWLAIRDAVPGNLIPIEDLTIENFY